VDTAIEVMPWQIFLDVLWSGGFGVWFSRPLCLNSYRRFSPLPQPCILAGIKDQTF
jgi:hypothetical protein